MGLENTMNSELLHMLHKYITNSLLFKS